MFWCIENRGNGVGKRAVDEKRYDHIAPRLMHEQISKKKNLPALSRAIMHAERIADVRAKLRMGPMV